MAKVKGLKMQIIPAIDLKGGECVRLRQGRMDDATVFSANPVSMAGKWFEAGSPRLHMVDLDGAFAGSPANASVINEVCEAYPELVVQVGGGIRTLESIETYLKAGVKYVIIGTKAVKEPEFVELACKHFPGSIIVGLDAKNGKVATDGWADVSTVDATDLAKRFADVGVNSIIYTDINRDGMMQGVNIEATVALAKAAEIPVIASGGVSSIVDIEKLCAVANQGIEGVIVGRAIYEGTLDLVEAHALALAAGK